MRPGTAEVVVVGGGIGGLAAALAVAARGHRAVVLERGEFAELGAGIQLAPNGIRALDRLGLGAQVRERGVHIDELRFMDGVSGEHVASLPLKGAYPLRFGNPYVVVHRGELYGLLLAACRSSGAVELRAGSAVTSYRQDGAAARVRLSSGEEVAGDAVIGADGIHSAVRRQLVGDGEPRVSGITVYRTVIPMERVPVELRWNAVTWWAGPGCHFVHYAIAGGRYLNLAPSVENGAAEAFSGVPAGADEVRAAFASLSAVAQRLLALGEDWKSWVLVDRDPVEVWTDGRVALLGDAAHPMLHYAAQGACQALEDAVLLGELLGGDADCVPQALAAYNAQRRGRTARLTHLARQSTRLWHPAGEAALARNAMLSALSETELHDQVAWMHGAREFGGARPAQDPAGAGAST
ncbi:FAD-dependent monooxygenase [Streptomyces cocklensis]|uniref:3-hydroxybenzoate 6-hydroxylase 1 n=1 Tax=Actinacidiphila cocklensis TaxID=887465 RepID=A0A9W4DTM1_9ACTN|nr:FAD-dependent monooxygenase [Actinacidiphila cocklensis]MDD1063414.1 FAD-dependent monooxygenase [Actinacidiphila cocklensis]CAG6395971.1 3-hydroxybenzoate 6-hydroxylase 1 [Actinacidiphila cocklensis]